MTLLPYLKNRYRALEERMDRCRGGSCQVVKGAATERENKQKSKESQVFPPAWPIFKKQRKVAGFEPLTTQS